MSRLAVLWVVSVWILNSAMAAPEDVPLKPVLVLPAGTECVATITYPPVPEGTKPLPMPSQRIFLFTGVDASQTTVMSNKRTFSEYVRGHYYLAWDSLTKIQLGVLGQEGIPADFRSVHFPELEWVNTPEAIYKGIDKRGKEPVCIYENKAGQRLLVSLKTALPLRLETPNETYSYSYRDSGLKGTKVPLQPELQARWDKIKANALRYQHKQLED